MIAQTHAREPSPRKHRKVVSMALELYMVGLIVRDMRAAVTFYRHLGLAIPEGGEEQKFVEIKMTGMSLFLDATASVWDPGYVSSQDALLATQVGKHGHLLEFNLRERDAVDAMYAKLTNLGYRSHRAPYEVSSEAYFALVFDPDGNMALLSA
jgi:catechol 2,3-dioxygenase-like lactoylglutathione lyase family enzyme